MKQGELIRKTISTLKERLKKNNGILEIQCTEGFLIQVSCQFNEPTKSDDLICFQKALNINLPIDYVQFLYLTNGCSLFNEVKTGGESLLYSIQNIVNEDYAELNSNFLTIGRIFQDDILIDLSRSKNGFDNYINIKSSIDQFDDSIKLNMNFELWFDRFIVCQGDKFWDWPFYSAENYYRISK
ncbi:SMI1/KNR4 family protein [Leptospira levettii]|uniref:SMI1/KNR4 family protein n=1 Tax=Leptospira levettii TaxID=2023178 RepID=UPI00108268AC|nr:SMI1/KNR4 family protein [Leptospira levettii]TGK92552.1 SMI1/KNR4 family protein [Leptospira levettii]